ncbi:DNA translocase FtsK [Tessaracoccus massiliensis]|uniref:DNA translocase FtsK n=1 Tax=Tessaracoccus massiliensis TaxID=1522311 RepID=UPI0009439C1C|nr:DNA translocase FtsK [Tessaracoccus massiliensis]
MQRPLWVVGDDDTLVASSPDYSTELPPPPTPAGTAAVADAATDACRYAATKGVVSSSMLQRDLHIDADMAEKVLAVLESQKIIGPANGPFPRAVLIKPAQLNASLGRVRSAAARTPQVEGISL